MITRLYVRNFKSLRELDLHLGPINVFVGPNMAGKSNILDVVRFVHQVVFPQPGTTGVGYAITQRGGANEVLWKGGDDKLITIGLEAADDQKLASTYQYRLELLAGIGGYFSIQNESLKLLRAGQEHDLIFQRQGIGWLKNADGKELGGVSTSGESPLQHPSPIWDGYAFQKYVENWRFYHLLPRAMKESGPMSEGQALTEDGDNLSAWLMWLQAHSPESFAQVNEVLCDLFPEVEYVRVIPTSEGRVYLLAKERGLKYPTRVSQLSDGFLVLIALLSLVYAPRELAGGVLCIEEPENYLHPKLLETLVALLRQVGLHAQDSRGPQTQFVFTTQSPYFLNQFSLDEMLWVEKRDGQTRAYRPSDKEHLKKLVKDKDLGLGDLMYSGVLGEEE